MDYLHFVECLSIFPVVSQIVCSKVRSWSRPRCSGLALPCLALPSPSPFPLLCAMTRKPAVPSLRCYPSRTWYCLDFRFMFEPLGIYWAVSSKTEKERSLAVFCCKCCRLQLHLKSKIYQWKLGGVDFVRLNLLLHHYLWLQKAGDLEPSGKF